MAERTELIRGIYERWGEGNFAADAELFDPHALLVLGPDFPDAGTYVGVAEIAEYTRQVLEPWEGFRIAAEELIPAGDSVVAGVVQRGVGSGSGIEAEFRYFQVWTFRGKRIVRLENFRERDQALAAVGIG